MTKSPLQTVPAARATRIMHLALVLGVILAAAVLGYRSAIAPPPFVVAPIMAYVAAAFGFVNLLVATAFLLPRIPRRSAAETPDDYWSRNETRTAAIIVWAVIEGSSFVALVGYFLTGGVAPAIVAGLGIVVLIVARPARIEGDAA